MAWILDTPLTCIQRFCVNIIKSGQVPRHIAFIMDGNRRYATKNHIKKVAGHKSGFDKLAETLKWCFELGIEEVTVYAFSIENFKRSQEEVEGLMELAKEKFRNLLEEGDKLKEEGVCVRVIGNLSLIPEDIRRDIAKAMIMTRNNKKLFLNVGFAYTSKDEICSSIKTIINGVKNDEISIDDIDEKLISDCLYTNHSKEPDILIRTSGEVRFSDFLLWQSWNSLIYFTDILWPEFSIWHLLGAVFQYQRQSRNSECLNKDYNECNEKVKNFLDNVDEKRWAQLELYAKN
nr:dehydrodolichyl diphosphate synthase complex subunit Dhdds [Onthophagus taurus]